MLTGENTADFLPRERHLRRKLAVETVRIDDNISIVSEGGESHPIVRLIRESLCKERANIAINVSADRMFVAAAEKGKVTFANCFEVNSDEDILYYLLAVCEHLELQASQTPIAYMTKIPDNVRKYFEVRKIVM